LVRNNEITDIKIKNYMEWGRNGRSERAILYYQTLRKIKVLRIMR